MAVSFREALESLFTLPKRKGRLNIFKGKTEFRAQILTRPLPYAGVAKATDDPETRSKLEEQGIPSKYQFICRLLDDQMAHNKFLEDPCYPSTTPSPEETALLVSLHSRGTVSTDDLNAGQNLQPGDMIYVTVDPGDSEMPYDLQNVTFSRVDTFFRRHSAKLHETCTTLAQQFADGGWEALGSHAIDRLETAAPEVGADQFVEGDSLTRLTSIAEGELKFWSGKVETDSKGEIYDRLKLYWNAVGWKEASWVPIASNHWSGAFISYVMVSVDPQFPVSSGHATYSNSAQQGKGNWTLWSLSSGDKIKAQVGDILVRKRDGPKGTESHGDAVYKIEGSKATAFGGNKGAPGTVRDDDTALQLTSEGYYQSTGAYTIVLKKNGKIVEESGAP
jgi:hypothetical protein